MCGFLQADESLLQRSGGGASDTRLPKRGLPPPTNVNDGKYDELELSGNDIFIQEFYLHCYSMITKERKNFLESREGFSYIMSKHAARMSEKLLTFLKKGLQKWKIILGNVIKRIKKDQSDDFDTEYVDIDTLLALYLQ